MISISIIEIRSKPVAKRGTFLADLGLLYAAAVWGSTFFIVKDSLNAVSPNTLIAFRFLLAAGGMALWIYFSGRSLFANWRKGLILGAVLWALYFPQTVGLLFTSAANSGFITGLFVAFLPPLYFIFFRKIPPVQRQVAVFLAIIGLWFLTGGIHNATIGDGITLVASFFYALHILFADRFIKDGTDPVALSFQQFFVVGIFSLTAALVLGEPLTVATSNALYAILFLAAIPTLSAFVIQLYAQRISGPVKVGLIFAMEPLFAAVMAWTIGGEQMNSGQLLGGSLIIFAMVLSELPIGKNTNRQ